MKALIILCVLGLAAAQGGHHRKGHSYSFSSPSNELRDSYGNYVGQPSNANVPHRSYESSPSAPGVSKRFFTFIAEDIDDDEDYDDYSYGQQRGSSSKDVIFAKAPVQSTRSLANALRRVVRAAPSLHVVNQKPSASEINGAYHSAGISHNRPDVHFHNYETDDEFAHITQQIKAQYESLGGSTQDFGTQTVPVQSFANRGTFGGSLAGALRRVVRAAPSLHVVNQKPSASEINDAYHSAGISHNRPDVHFHNYETDDEFAHITQQIKAQYESLGGTTQDFGTQTVPVQSFANRGTFDGSLAGALRRVVRAAPSLHVVNQKPSASEINGAYHSAGISHNRPDVHFHNYETDDEFAHITQQIKAQYESLGGTTQDFGTQTVPVQSFANRGTFDGSLAGALRRVVRAAPSLHDVNQKPSASEINGAYHSAGISHNRPDVHFHNYETDDEFAQITQQIKAQYESLGGSTQDFGAQTVPVQSFATRGTFGGNGPQVSFLKYRTPDEAANIIQHIKGQYEALGGPTQDFGAESVRVESGNRYRHNQYHGNNGNYHLPSSSYQQSYYHAPSSLHKHSNYHVPSVNNRFSVPSSHYQHSSYNVPSVNNKGTHYHQTHYTHQAPAAAPSTTFLTPVSNYLPPRH